MQEQGLRARKKRRFQHTISPASLHIAISCPGELLAMAQADFYEPTPSQIRVTCEPVAGLGQIQQGGESVVILGANDAWAMSIPLLVTVTLDTTGGLACPAL